MPTVPSKRRLNQSLRKSDLALNSLFHGRSYKQDYLPAWSIKSNVTYLYDPGGTKRESLLCAFFLKYMKSLSEFIFC